MSVTHGDFTALADDYSKYREGYAPSVRDAFLGLPASNVHSLDIVDVGAGTGIWTRMLAERDPGSLTAVEPNSKMRERGMTDSVDYSFNWVEGSGEHTGRPDNSADVVSMASSFHWVDFERGLCEFSRILKPGGWFGALWNPRVIEANPLLVEIESYVKELNPQVERVTSSRSGLISQLSDRLRESELFGNVTYVEGRHLVRQSIPHYLGLWRSANDVQVQLGPELFEEFMNRTEARLENVDYVETTYMTTLWAAQSEY
ncbi:class I SAM-dependent methyltransferase [Rothia koreensis]|uniref:class I SAM-dependent methyltransferase n=1 Tax=Rothia koreensis TaxID=592378 RepID=UPI0037C62CB4